MLRVVSKGKPAEAFLVVVPMFALADYRANPSYIKTAARSIAPVQHKSTLVVLWSISHVGTP